MDTGYNIGNPVLILGKFHTEGAQTLVQEPRETVKSPSVEIIKTQLDKALRNLM